jgi:hypothetical protein
VSAEDRVPDSEPSPNTRLVPVLETTERAILPLAEAALTQEGIDYSVEHRGLSDQIFGTRSSSTVGETDEPFAVVVRSEDASRARQLLDALTAAPVGPPVESEAAPKTTGTPPRPPAASAEGDVALFDAATGLHVGSLSEIQFETLASHLERESSADDDYYVTGATLEMLADTEVDAATVDLLRRALAGRDGMDIRWVRTSDAL